MTTPGKICSIEQLGIESARLKALGKRVVLCHGTFDLMHTGHIRHLQRARQEGDVLFVSLTADKFVNKGPGRPVFSEDLRAETLAALGEPEGLTPGSAPGLWARVRTPATRP